MYASIIDMTLRLPVDEVLFDELRTDFLPQGTTLGLPRLPVRSGRAGRAVGITRLGRNART